MMIGIDLGTTNSALAWIDPKDAEDTNRPSIQLLPIPQLVAEGVTEPRRVLASFLFLSNPAYAGVLAREQGALTPTRVVNSAKSWLANPEVDRTAPILPWDAPQNERILSPVDASVEFLSHIRRAWDAAHRVPLAELPVVLTVPASFDEEARELTVAAAQKAGLGEFTLLEEPAAAFSAWVATHPAESHKTLFDGQTVLVCDVGGGTTDFTLIRVGRQGDQVEFTRTAVGKHLLLGGDNLDLALSWLVETKLGQQLSLRQRTSMRRQCAAAKERLLSDGSIESVEITVAGSGRALVGGTLRTEVTREEVLAVAFEGFLPPCGLGDRPQEEKRSLFRELGLPYVSDPAITRHLAAFLADSGTGPEGPDAILFNGGFFNPEPCRERLADVMESWYGRRPQVLASYDLDLAVAMGAAYHCYARHSGAGLLVRGGLPRTYYIGLGDPPAEGAGAKAVCLVPRGTEDGSLLSVDREDLELVANRPVSFRLYSSLTRSGEAQGEVTRFTSEELDNGIHMHAPLHAVIRFGKRSEERRIPVSLKARLTEVGTLEIWCESRISEHRWKLQFELRKSAAGATTAPSVGGGMPAGGERKSGTLVAETAVAEGVRFLREVCGENSGSVAPEQVPGRLEQILSVGRNSWPLEVLRKLGDVLLEQSGVRRRNADWESRWLNLCGFCLRPGFGYPGDDFRIEQARRVYAAGMEFGNRPQNQIEWWIFWGRVAGGLNRNQQVDIYQRISATLLPQKNAKLRVNTSLLRQMWRTAASLELLPTQTKIQLGEALLKRIKQRDYTESELWCMGRLGARQLFYGPANQVVAPATATVWANALLPLEQSAEALASIARQTGDAARDLPPTTFEMVKRKLEALPNSQRLLPMLEGERLEAESGLSRMFGEVLPSGLALSGGGGE